MASQLLPFIYWKFDRNCIGSINYIGSFGGALTILQWVFQTMNMYVSPLIYSFNKVLWFSWWWSHTSFVRFILEFFKILFSLLMICRNAVDLCLFILYLATMLNAPSLALHIDLLFFSQIIYILCEYQQFFFDFLYFSCSC